MACAENVVKLFFSLMLTKRWSWSLAWLKRLARDKHSNIFACSISENKCMALTIIACVAKIPFGWVL
jgi:hypothetical protein